MSVMVSSKKSACRALFGKPTVEQQQATDEWLNRVLEESYQKNCKQWGFDFRTGLPLEDEASCSLWSYDVISESEVPRYYRTQRIRTSTGSSISAPSSPSTSDKDVSLMSIPMSDSDISMDFEPMPENKRANKTPKKRPIQNKMMTDFMPIRRKKSCSPRKSPIGRVVPASPSTSRSPRRAARHF